MFNCSRAIDKTWDLHQKVCDECTLGLCDQLWLLWWVQYWRCWTKYITWPALRLQERWDWCWVSYQLASSDKTETFSECGPMNGIWFEWEEYGSRLVILQGHRILYYMSDVYRLAILDRINPIYDFSEPPTTALPTRRSKRLSSCERCGGLYRLIYMQSKCWAEEPFSLPMLTSSLIFQSEVRTTGTYIVICAITASTWLQEIGGCSIEPG